MSDKQKKLINKWMKKEDKKRNTITKGDNVIHLDYVHSHFSKSDLKSIKDIVENNGFQFSSFDKEGSLYATLDEISLVIFLYISQNLILRLIENATWDFIKVIVLSIWKKVKDKKYYKISSSKTEEKYLTFGLKIDGEDKRSFDFYLTHNTNEEVTKNAIKEIFKYMEYNNKKGTKNSQYFCSFNEDKKKWECINKLDEMKKKIK